MDQNYQPVQPQQNYQPVQPQYYPQANTQPMTVGQYIVTFIVLAISLVGFIMSLVWAFGANANINKRNFCRAYLIIGIIGGILAALFSTVFVTILTDILNSM